MPDAPPTIAAGRGLTPRQVARLLRVRVSRVLGWIRSGQLAALNTADARCRRPRFVVLPHALEEFARGRAAATPPRPPRRRKNPTADYFPDLPG